ncbi:MAG: hypothetical protein ACLFR6_01305 [Salinarchaeum sp.]
MIPSRPLERHRRPVSHPLERPPHHSVAYQIIQYDGGRLKDDNLGRLFPFDEWDTDELGIVHGAVLAAVYHMIRAESEREEVTNILTEITVNESFANMPRKTVCTRRITVM